MSISPEESYQFPMYLGDGVYASFDGYQIWLAANHCDNRVVALEPAVFQQLLLYARSLSRKIEKQAMQTADGSEEGASL